MVPSGGGWTRSGWTPTLLVAAACVALLFTWRVALYHRDHPVVDRYAYEVQADGLARGELFLPDRGAVPEWARRFTAPTEDGRLFKYLPGTAALGAVSLRLTDSFGLALGLTSLALVVSTSGVGKELGWGPRRRAVAAGLVGASPVVLTEGSVLLSYVPSVALCTTALWLTVAATGAPTARRTVGADGPDPAHRHPLVLAAGAGLILGLALTVRQVEVLAWTVVLVAWCAVAPGAPARTRRRRSIALVAGLVPGVLLVLALNHTLTGDAWRMPFTVVSPDDGPGWGWRRVFGSDGFEYFNGFEALRATPRALLDLTFWTLAGPALVGGALVATWIGRRSPVHLLLVALGAVVPFAYLFHWANTHAVQARFYLEAGPFYLLACVPPLVLLGVDGLAALPRRLVVGCVVVALAAQVVFFADRVADRWEVERATGPAPAASLQTGGAPP